jgi:hypothetical protein
VTRDALRAWRGEAARARLRGQLAGVAGWPWMRRRRPGLRRASDEAIESLLRQAP